MCRYDLRPLLEHSEPKMSFKMAVLYGKSLICLAGIRICYLFKVFQDRINCKFLWCCDLAIDMFARVLGSSLGFSRLFNETLN